MSKNGVFKPYKLISVWFNDKERSEYETWISERNLDVLNVLLELQENGFKMSVSSSNNDLLPLVTISVKPKRKNGQGVCFLYRHNDLEKCLYIAYYHFVVATNFGTNVDSLETSVDW